MKTGQWQDAFLTGLLCLLALGIVAGSRFPAVSLTVLLFPAVLLLVLSIWMAGRSSSKAYLAFGLLFFVLGMMRYAGSISLPAADISHAAGRDVQVTGTLVGAPQITQAADGTWKLRYEVQAEQVKLPGGGEQTASGGLYIYARAKDSAQIPPAKIGDTIRASGALRRPHSYGNPGQLDTALLLRTQGITAQLFAGKSGVRAEPAERRLFSRSMAEIREHYLESMEAAMPQADAAAIFAMLFGGYGGIRPELLEAFTATGIVHILSVSGSHISLMAAVMAWLANLLRLPRMMGAAMVIGMIFIYSALAGFVPPVIRSALMGGLSFLAVALGREKEAGRILLLTGMAMLLASPLLLFHISFQLSFLATAGLVYIAPIAKERLRCLPEAVAGSLSITLGAQLSTLPVLAWYFNQISLSSFLANLVIVPLVEGMIVLGLFAGAVGWVLPFLGRLVFIFDSLLLGVVYELTRVMAHLPGSQIYFPTMGIAAVVLYSLLLLYVLQPGERRERLRAKLASWRRAAAMFFLAGLLLTLGWRLIRPPEMSVHFIDVGQGDAALVITPHGHAMMFDAGGSRDGNFDVGARVDVPYLWHYGIRELDGIFLTHAHEDHAAGAGAVLQKIPVKHVFTAGEGRGEYAHSMKLSDSAPELSLLAEAQEGSRFTVDGVTVEVVFAPKVDTKTAKSGNEASNVYRITYGKASFLITGDLTKENERLMLEKDCDVRCTVLKVGHHGSDTSSCEEFLQAAGPHYAVICVGADNSFGHPKAAVLERLLGIGAKILRTDRDGAIRFCTDGQTIRVKTYVE